MDAGHRMPWTTGTRLRNFLAVPGRNGGAGRDMGSHQLTWGCRGCGGGVGGAQPRQVPGAATLPCGVVASCLIDVCSCR